MSTYRKPSVSSIKLILPALLALLPLLILGSGVVTTTQAAIPTDSRAEAQNPQQVLVLHVYFRDAAERDRLATEFGAEEESTRGGYLTIVTDPAGYNKLITRGLRVEIDEEQTRQINDPNYVSDTFYGGYRTVEEMQAFLDQKVAEYPNLAQKLDIGDSWCKTHPGQCPQPAPGFAGYDLLVLRVTNRDIPGPKGVMWIDGGIHTREIATPELAMRYISWLLDNYSTDANARYLVDYRDIHIMPMLNPDGHHITETPGEAQPYWHRKNADRDDGCTTWPPSSANHFGVDINRNFPFQWGCCGGSSPAPCDQTYRGPVEGSEEETQFMIAKVRELIPDQRVDDPNVPAPITTTGNLINIHSNAQQNLFPWGYTSNHAPNRPDLKNIGEHMSSDELGGNGYEACQNTECLYIVDGDEKNWAYGELGIPAYSLEVSGSGFFPPYVYTQTIWNENKNALIYMTNISDMPYLRTKGPDALLVATNPMTVTQGALSALNASIDSDWTDDNYGTYINLYRQNVAAAEYYIDTPPERGGVAIPLAPSDGSFNSPVEAVEATIDTSTLTLGRHIIFVRGRGINNYGGLQSWGPISAAWLTVTAAGGPSPTAPPTTPTSTRTSTATTVPPSVTTTPTSCCGSMTGAVLPSCYVDPTPSTTSFHGLVELNNPCPTSVPVTITTQLHISVDGTNWQTWAQTPARQVVVPPGPPPYGVNEYFYNQNIPAQFNYYRIYSVVNELSYCREYFLMSPTRDICRVSTTPTPQATATACTITFTDVDESNIFYPFIRCLACRGVLGGYDDGTFRPYNDITRGQIAKVVSNAAGFDEDPGAQIYEDVDANNPFYQWINRLSMRGHMGGYPCGTIDLEPCIEPGNRPYFRPFNNATRGQLAKIVANAAGIGGTPTGIFYTDVQEDNPFYTWIMRLTELGVMSGYECGGPGEPCDEENRPYFRPFNNVTRGQASKIVANTFYPNCQTPIR